MVIQASFRLPHGCISVASRAYINLQNRSYMEDKIQKITSYVSGHGLRVYEIEQYNKQCNDWFIVGNCSTDAESIASLVELHNTRIKYSREWVSANIPF